MLVQYLQDLRDLKTKDHRRIASVVHFSFFIFHFSFFIWIPCALQRDMNPRPFIYEFDVRQMVADVCEPAWVHRDVHGPTLCVVAVDRSANGSIEGLTAEA